MAYRILIVDDEPEMVQMLSRFLSRSGYEIIPAFTGEEAVASIKAHPDIILLDINMPGMDGISVCKEVRDKIGCPILFLTAKDQEADKIEGFTAGGDDYITKPFSLAELKVRIDAHLRREHREKQVQRKVFGDITVDYSAQEVFVCGESMHFLRKEFEIIRMLSLNSGQVFSRSYIYETIWGLEACGDDNVIMEHIRKIRQRFGKAGCINPIETVWGVGYRWIK